MTARPRREQPAPLPGTESLSPGCDHLLLAHIARRAGVGRAAVVNWRRHHPDFPPPVGGTDVHPEFDPDAVDRWLHLHGKVATYLPRSTATVTLPDGTTVTLHHAWLRRDEDGFVELGGGTDPDAWIPLHDAVLTRVHVEGLPDVTVSRAVADITDRPARYIHLLWRAENEQPLPAQPASR